MTVAVIDDHLLRDVLSDDIGRALRSVIRAHDLATTNLFYYRLCRSAVAGRGGALTRAWSPLRRRALSQALVQLTDEIVIVPMASIVHRMAELAADHPVSTLGAEAVAAAEHLGGSLYVWDGDNGPRIGDCASAAGVRYRTVKR
jgi:hypothetical protein